MVLLEIYWSVNIKYLRILILLGYFWTFYHVFKDVSGLFVLFFENHVNSIV